MKHARVVTTTPKGEGEEIRTEGYYKSLNSVKIQTRQNIRTTQETLLTDVIKCLEVLSEANVPELIIEVHKERDTPTRIVKTWTIYKEKL